MTGFVNTCFTSRQNRAQDILTKIEFTIKKPTFIVSVSEACKPR